MGKLDESVLELLRGSSGALSLAEIAERLGEREKAVYKALRRLFEKGQIESRGRQYTIAKE